MTYEPCYELKGADLKRSEALKHFQRELDRIGPTNNPASNLAFRDAFSQQFMRKISPEEVHPNRFQTILFQIAPVVATFSLLILCIISIVHFIEQESASLLISFPIFYLGYSYIMSIHREIDLVVFNSKVEISTMLTLWTDNYEKYSQFYGPQFDTRIAFIAKFCDGKVPMNSDIFEAVFPLVSDNQAVVQAVNDNRLSKNLLEKICQSSPQD